MIWQNQSNFKQLFHGEVGQVQMNLLRNIKENATVQFLIDNAQK